MLHNQCHIACNTKSDRPIIPSTVEFDYCSSFDFHEITITVLISQERVTQQLRILFTFFTEGNSFSKTIRKLKIFRENWRLIDKVLWLSSPPLISEGSSHSSSGHIMSKISEWKRKVNIEERKFCIHWQTKGGGHILGEFFRLKQPLCSAAITVFRMIKFGLSFGSLCVPPPLGSSELPSMKFYTAH